MPRIDVNMGAAKCEYFNEIYFNLHESIFQHGNRQESRNGPTFEFTQFKTMITNPYKRCVGGYNRNMNIFFSLAEALWIMAGRKDVAFLDNFNKQLKEYSDDGMTYHAPYGYRMRSYGHSSQWPNISPFAESEPVPCMDQISRAVDILYNNSEDRRVVVAVWNPWLDLGTKSKDLPCNDLLMLKIRNNQLNFTIANRSNDLNLGLTTNVFQFSFLAEMLAGCLGVGLGSQVHTSDSLHVYTEFDVTKALVRNMDPNIVPSPNQDVYETCAPMLMDFNFSTPYPVDRLAQLDQHVQTMIVGLQQIADGNEIDERYIEINLRNFSGYLYLVYQLLKVYVLYSRKKDKINRIEAWGKIVQLNKVYYHGDREYFNGDLLLMGANFFQIRMLDSKDETERNFATDNKKYWPQFGKSNY